MNSVAAAAEMAVAVNTAAGSIPAAERIDGFTARMYTIETKVITPPRTSLRIVVPRSFSLNTFSISTS